MTDGSPSQPGAMIGMPDDSAIRELTKARTERNRTRFAGLILATMTLALTVLANLPYSYEESEISWIGYLETSTGGRYLEFQDMPVMAGWPLRYWVRYTRGGVIEDRLWMPERLVLNSLLGLSVVAAIYLFVQVRGGLLRRNLRDRRARWLLDGSVALIILAVPGGIFGWEYHVTRHHLQVAKQLEQNGTSFLSCWLPATYSKYVPVGVKRKLTRIRQVHTFGVNKDLAEIATALPTLAAFQSQGRAYDAESLRFLADSPHLCVFHLTRCELTDRDVSLIAKLKWLNQLSLAKTNLNAKQLEALDHLKLRFVDLSFTDVALSDIHDPSWSSTAEILLFSRPPDGIESSLKIEGWPMLKHINIERLSSRMNDAIMDIRLVDLPQLQSIHIDRVQRHDLELKNLPRLARIDEGISDVRYVTDNDLLLPGLTWVRSLAIDGADSLTSFGCFGRDLERFSMKGVPSLRSFAIGSYLSTLLGRVQPTGVDAERLRVWIRQLGEMEGPSTLDLSYLPLAGQELTPLAGNQRIRYLNLSATGVTFDKIQQLAGMEALEHLIIPSTPLSKNQLAWVLNEYPNVKKLRLDVNDLETLDLRGRGRLRDLQVTPMKKLDEIRVVDLPDLCASIRLTNTPTTFEVRNAFSLRGLAVEAPWPESAELKGLRDLEWFTGGGKAIDDQVVGEVLQCDTMNRLTLAYVSATEKTLRRIGELTELNFLALPGAEIDDTVVQDWDELSSLWEVNFDDTKISTETIGWLSRMKSLRRVSLKRVQLCESAQEALSELTQISDLYLAEVEMPCHQLGKLLQQIDLEALDLSGWEFNEELVNLLCSEGRKLKYLIIGDSHLDEVAFHRLLEAAPELYLEMDELPEFVDQSSREELYRRAEVFAHEMNTGWRLMLRPSDVIFQQMSAAYIDDGAGSVEGMPRIPQIYIKQLNRELFTP